MILILLFTSFFAFAKEPVYWSHILEVSDQHEFYHNHENITKSKDSWQTLFSLVYIDSDLKRLKDCVFFKVPGADTGVLKIKSIASTETCESYLLSPGDKEVTNIKSLQFAVLEKEVKIDFSLADFTAEKWEATLQSSFRRPEPKMNLSSAQYKSPSLILLAPRSMAKVNGKEEFLKDKELCHNINEDCEEVSPSICHQCKDGWYEVPNGCSQGPKYCGLHDCGGKDQPACRRGMKWQKKEVEEFDCRTDTSFAYCSKGHTVTCEGKKAFCR